MLLPVSPYPSKGASALVGSTDLSLPRIMALTIIRPVSSLSFRGTLLQIAAECVDALDVGIPSEHEASSAKVRISSELSALRLESRLGLHRHEKPLMAFNISHSTIASLNLGTVVGDLTASIQSLVGQGQDDLAEALRGLAEAITESRELEDAQRKELLEHLSLVSTEVALPPDRRKTGPLKSSIAFLQTGLRSVAQLASLLSTAEQALRVIGVLPS